ncbi:MAG: hypothetical protein HFI12_05055 [Lachnospiraceae bacterium]|jgi:hypothetical protein|nr:hypothetical protein [Lachnospiraceae bacterium]
MSKKIKGKKVSKNIPKNKTMYPDIPKEWLYMLPEDRTLREMYEVARACKEWEAEYWEEAKALEIAVPEAGSVDIECIEAEEELLSYMREKKAEKVYAVTVVPEYWERARAVMQYLMAHLGGFFCGDTEDFKPEISKEG